MTQHYLAGELSLILSELEDVATSEAAVHDVERLRREAETVPLTKLGSVTARALELADGWCWESLSRGNALAFTRQGTICGELWEFGVCAGLLEDG